MNKWDTSTEPFSTGNRILEDIIPHRQTTSAHISGRGVSSSEGAFQIKL